MAMKLEDLMPVKYDKTEYKWKVPRGDFIVEVQPIIAQSVNLCGYPLDFFKSREPETGKWVHPIFTLDSRKFPPRVESDLKSVLPEIIVKLTNPLAPIVRIINTEVIKRVEPKTKEKRNA